MYDPAEARVAVAVVNSIRHYQTAAYVLVSDSGDVMLTPV